MCEIDLVSIDSLIIEIPIASSVQPELASGSSYWMYRLEMFSDWSIENEKDKYWEDYGWESCNVKLIEKVNEQSDEYDVSAAYSILELLSSCSIINTGHSLTSLTSSTSSRHQQKDGY